MPVRVTTVVVTYGDRASLLARVVEAVFGQTLPVERLIVIDNGASSATKSLLRDLKGVRDNLEVVTLEENSGSAGGYDAGMRRAVKEGADFLWLLDDDNLPAPGALDELVEQWRKAAVNEPETSLALVSRRERAYLRPHEFCRDAFLGFRWQGCLRRKLAGMQ